MMEGWDRFRSERGVRKGDRRDRSCEVECFERRRVLLRGRSGRVQEWERARLRGGRMRRKGRRRRRRRRSHRWGEWARGGDLGSKMHRRCCVGRGGERGRGMMITARMGGGPCGQAAGIVRSEVAVCSSNNGGRDGEASGGSNQRDSFGVWRRGSERGVGAKVDEEYSRASLGESKMDEGSQWEHGGGRESPTVLSRVDWRVSLRGGSVELKAEKGSSKSCAKHGCKPQDKEQIVQSDEGYSGGDGVDGKEEMVYKQAQMRDAEGAAKTTNTEKGTEEIQSKEKELLVCVSSEDMQRRGSRRGLGGKLHCTLYERIHDKHGLDVAETNSGDDYAQVNHFLEDSEGFKDIEKEGARNGCDPTISRQQCLCASQQSLYQHSKGKPCLEVGNSTENGSKDVHCNAESQRYGEEFFDRGSPKPSSKVVLGLNQAAVDKSAKGKKRQCASSGHSKTTLKNIETRSIEATASTNPKPNVDPGSCKLDQKPHYTSGPVQEAIAVRCSTPSAANYDRIPETTKCDRNKNTPLNNIQLPRATQVVSSISHGNTQQLPGKQDCELQIRVELSGVKQLMPQVRRKSLTCGSSVSKNGTPSIL